MVGLSGCATVKESVLTGIATGAVTGLVLGPLIDSSAPDAKAGGAVIGAVVGGISAYIIHNGMEERDARIRKETLFNLDKYNVSHPRGNTDYEFGIATPGVETECFNTEVKGDKLVQAHCESRIIGGPEWVRNPNRKKKSNE